MIDGSARAHLGDGIWSKDLRTVGINYKKGPVNNDRNSLPGMCALEIGVSTIGL